MAAEAEGPTIRFRNYKPKSEDLQSLAVEPPPAAPPVEEQIEVEAAQATTAAAAAEAKTTTTATERGSKPRPRDPPDALCRLP